MSPREFQEVAWESLGREEGRAVARDWGPQAHGGDPLTECRGGGQSPGVRKGNRVCTSLPAAGLGLPGLGSWERDTTWCPP